MTLPTTDRALALLVETGTLCISCGCEFTEPHGEVTACTYCYDRLKHKSGIRRATHPEANRQAHERQGHARKHKETR